MPPKKGVSCPAMKPNFNHEFYSSDGEQNASNGIPYFRECAWSVNGPTARIPPTGRTWGLLGLKTGQILIKDVSNVPMNMPDEAC